MTIFDIQKAIKNLGEKENEIERYATIIGNVWKLDVSRNEDFQRTYVYFYKVRRGADWRSNYFIVLESIKNKEDVSFEFILNEIYKKTGKVEASFASKMLATIDTNKPIWDSKVLKRVGIAPSKKHGDEKIYETIEKYKELLEWYSTLLEDKDESSKYINAFDNRFPQYTFLSDVKKIDFILWAMDDSTDVMIPSSSIKFPNYDFSKYSFNTSDVYEKFSGVTKAIGNIYSVLPEYLTIADNVTKTITSIAESFAPIVDFQKRFEESVLPTFEKISQVFAGIQLKLPKIEIPEELIKSLGNIRYLYILSEIKWPLFLQGDKCLREQVNELCNCEKDNYPLDELAEIICSYYSDRKIEKMLDAWKKLEIASSRLGILEEAIRLHNNGMYYGATALLMCQVEGIITDISEYAKLNDLSVDEEDERILCEDFQVKYEDHLKGLKKHREKHMMLRLMLYPDSGLFYWQAVTDYIYNVILTSDDSAFREHNPMRNKICHGVHTDFGTKEKSLKSILVIDLLLNLYADLNWMISNADEE